MSLNEGRKLGRYEIRSQIGAGGMGEVYRASDPKIGRDVAIKVLPSDFASNEERVERFEREAQAAGSLNHPNILGIYDIDSQDGTYFVVSELLVGSELRDRLNDTPMPSKVHVTEIAGDCVPTAHRVLARRDGSYAFYPDELRPGEEHLAPLLFESGDGTVPVSSAVAGTDASLFCDGHQGIATDPNVHRALVRTLRSPR